MLLFYPYHFECLQLDADFKMAESVTTVLLTFRASKLESQQLDACGMHAE